MSAKTTFEKLTNGNILITFIGGDIFSLNPQADLIADTENNNIINISTESGVKISIKVSNVANPLNLIPWTDRNSLIELLSNNFFKNDGVSSEIISSIEEVATNQTNGEQKTEVINFPDDYSKENGGNLSSIKTKTDNLDILISVLRDSIAGISPNNKTLYDVVTQLTTQINIKIFDEITSTFKGLRFNNGSPRIISQPYTYEIAEGHIPGHDKFVKIGYNGALGNSFEDLWTVGGTYVFPDAAQQMEIVSSSAQDGVDGTGVRSVRLTYLTDDFTVATEDITLNGVTPVLTVATDIYRVQNMRSLTTGTGYVAAGNIDIRNLAETPIYGRIATGYNRLRQCIYTVPKGKTLYITNVLVGCGATTAGRAVTFNTMATYDDISNSLIPFFQILSEILLQDASISLTLDVPTKLIAGTDFKVRAISPDGMTYSSCIMRGWME